MTALFRLFNLEVEEREQNMPYTSSQLEKHVQASFNALLCLFVFLFFAFLFYMPESFYFKGGVQPTLLMGISEVNICPVAPSCHWHNVVGGQTTTSRRNRNRGCSMSCHKDNGSGQQYGSYPYSRSFLKLYSSPNFWYWFRYSRENIQPLPDIISACWFKHITFYQDKKWLVISSRVREVSTLLRSVPFTFQPKTHYTAIMQG